MVKASDYDGFNYSSGIRRLWVRIPARSHNLFALLRYLFLVDLIVRGKECNIPSWTSGPEISKYNNLTSREENNFLLLFWFTQDSLLLGLGSRLQPTLCYWCPRSCCCFERALRNSIWSDFNIQHKGIYTLLSNCPAIMARKKKHPLESIWQEFWYQKESHCQQWSLCNSSLLFSKVRDWRLERNPCLWAEGKKKQYFGESSPTPNKLCQKRLWALKFNIGSGYISFPFIRF